MIDESLRKTSVRLHFKAPFRQKGTEEMDAKTVNIYFDDAQKIVTILAVLFGAAASYFKFIKGRIWHLKVEQAASGSAVFRDGMTYLTVTSRLKNVGITKIEIRQRGTAISVSPAVLPKNGGVRTMAMDWGKATRFPVFESHARIEAGETIEEQRLVVIPGDKHEAFCLELRVVSAGIVWKAIQIVHCDPNMDNNIQSHPIAKRGN